MNAKDWMRASAQDALQDAVELTLPSGMVIKARRPNPMQLAMWGLVPSSLAGAVAGGTAARPDAEAMAALMSGLRDLLIFCCLQPRVSLNPVGDDEIHPRLIPDKDTMFLLRWATRGEEAGHLESFRSERPNGSAGSDGAAVQPETEQDAGDNGPGTGARTGHGRSNDLETVEAKG